MSQIIDLDLGHHLPLRFIITRKNNPPKIKMLLERILETDEASFTPWPERKHL